jgi:hypothetical protein
MKVDIRDEYANLVALVEELESGYGRCMLRTFTLEQLLSGYRNSAESIVRTIHREVLKEFRADNEVKTP